MIKKEDVKPGSVFCFKESGNRYRVLSVGIDLDSFSERVSLDYDQPGPPKDGVYYLEIGRFLELFDHPPQEERRQEIDCFYCRKRREDSGARACEGCVEDLTSFGRPPGTECEHGKRGWCGRCN